MPLQLNVFHTVTSVVPTNPVGIYTAPVGYSGVVLLAQMANIGTLSRDVSLSHQRRVAGIAVTTEIVKQIPVQGNDTISLLNGKLILESGDSLIISASEENSIKFIASILETLN